MSKTTKQIIGFGTSILLGGIAGYFAGNIWLAITFGVAIGLISSFIVAYWTRYDY